MFKKIILWLIIIMVVGIGGLFLINGKDNYDESKYFASATNGLNVGSKLEFTLPDQFDKPHPLTDKVEKLIFVFTKSTGHTVKEFLKKQDKDYLTKKNALFIADISPMPVVIRNTFALPDFKKSLYSVLLIYDKKISKKLKNGQKIEKIVVVTLNNKTISDVRFVEKGEEIFGEKR